MYKIYRLFHTLKYLKWPQFYFRVYRKLVKPRVTEHFIGVLPFKSDRFVASVLYDEKITPDLVATFLNHTKRLNLPGDWNDESHSKLWAYNLHYFEDLLSEGAANKHVLHISLLDKWALDNPVGVGIGWEPYTLSLRIVNILKAWHAGLPLRERHFKEIYAQASYLSNSLEKHLLGNHYFVNLKALLFAAVLFNNSRWLKIALDGLLNEIPEQILEDGANFELTPMYHSIILVDMLDMYNLCQAFRNIEYQGLSELISSCIPKMLRFMQVIAHNDDGLSFFNDSADGVAPVQRRIVAYAEALGFKVSAFDTYRVQGIDSFQSGYMVATSYGNKLIFDACNVGPDYIPGHAHADTLSFEFSIGVERVFVNTGTSQYGLSEKRLQERGTAAHNTVVVDDRDSSQVWSAFRVAKRARVIEREVMFDNSHVTLKASHNGYKKIYGGPIHTRILCLKRNSLSVQDGLKGTFNSAAARFHFHPDLTVSINRNILEVMGVNFVMHANLSGLSAKLIKSTWHKGFGLTQDNLCLECEIKCKSHKLEFRWKVI